MVVHHHPVNERPLKTPVSPWPPAVPLLEATLSAPIGMWIITTLRLMAALSAHVGPRISAVATSHADADGCAPNAHWLRPCLSSWCKLARGPWTRPPQWLCPLRPLVCDCLTTSLWWQHHPLILSSCQRPPLLVPIVRALVNSCVLGTCRLSGLLVALPSTPAGSRAFATLRLTVHPLGASWPVILHRAHIDGCAIGACWTHDHQPRSP